MKIDEQALGRIDAMVRAAGRTHIMPSFRRLALGSVRAKSGPLDLVTEADVAAERALTTALASEFPGCRVVGEEATAGNPSLTDVLGQAGLVFTVDPIDGTANYVAGLPVFATMVAAVEDGVVTAACIHDPVTQDSFLALAGQGARARDAAGEHRPLAVSAQRDLGRMTGSLSWRFLPEPRRTSVLRHALRLANTHDFRCAGHHYRMLSSGACEFSLYNRLLPWDHAPGWLLHREAGGYSARFDGSPYTPMTQGGGLLCAPDEASWQRLAEILLERQGQGAALDPPGQEAPDPLT